MKRKHNYFKSATMVTGIAALTLAGIFTVSADDAASISGSYSISANGYDDAACVDSVLVKLDQPITSISPEDLAVSENAMALNYETYQTEMATTPREITDAFLCDENGEKTDGASEYICISLKAAPGVGKVLESGMVGIQSLNVWAQNYSMNISLAEGAVLDSEGSEVQKLDIAAEYTDLSFSSLIESFDYTKEFTASDGITYKYATYTPAEESDTLVVWLHGLGEGGVENTDPRVILTAADSSVLAGEEFQSAVGGAHILVPQCPTWWMDPDGTAQVIDGASDSYYVNSLYELIQQYKEEIGAAKVALAGCSNGGYMTMQMLLHSPADYVCAVPICEAYMAPAGLWVDVEAEEESEVDEAAITAFKEKIDTIKDIPLFFIYSKDDPLVVPGMYEIPTINYLEEIGAPNLNVYASENVNMDYGDGEDHFAFGHASWVYFFNNTTGDTSVWSWMGEYLK